MARIRVIILFIMWESFSEKRMFSSLNVGYEKWWENLLYPSYSKPHKRKGWRVVWDQSPSYRKTNKPAEYYFRYHTKCIIISITMQYIVCMEMLWSEKDPLKAWRVGKLRTGIKTIMKWDFQSVLNLYMAFLLSQTQLLSKVGLDMKHHYCNH